MIIHVVQSGETINSIADKYGIPSSRLIRANGLRNPLNLVVGQTIVIVYPKEVHIVQEGDTLESIAYDYQITTIQLLRNNPHLLDRRGLRKGESIIISYDDEKRMDTTINGYAYPYINRDVLRKNLLYLTYLSIFSYTINPDGELDDIDDNEIIDIAKSFGVAPIMVLSYITENGTISNEIFHSILNNREIRNKLIADIYRVVRNKGYYGINIDTPSILEEDRELYYEFISLISEEFNKVGIKVFVTITPESFKSEVGRTELIDYSKISNVSDGVVLLTYSWGYAQESSIEETPFYLIELLYQIIARQVPAEKMTVGFSNIGYIISIPYVAGETRASSISATNVIQLARNTGAEINYNDVNLLSYFFVIDNESDNFFVYFHDVRAVEAVFDMIYRNGFNGMAIWNIMYTIPQTFLYINVLYNIIQVL